MEVLGSVGLINDYTNKPEDPTKCKHFLIYYTFWPLNKEHMVNRILLLHLSFKNSFEVQIFILQAAEKVSMCQD